MSDRIAVMNQGRIVQLDTPKALYARPQTRFVAEFIGESSLLPVEIEGQDVRLGDKLLKPSMPMNGATGRNWLVVRPEKLSVIAGSDDGALLNVFEGTVREIIYQGDSVICYVSLAQGGELAIRNYARSDLLAKIPAPGQPIRLGLGRDDTTIVAEDA